MPAFTDLQWVVDAYTLTLAAFILRPARWPTASGAGACSRGDWRSSRWRRWLARSSPDADGAERLARRPGRGRRGHVRRLARADRAGVPAARSWGRRPGIYGATIGVAVAIGPLVGGALTDGSAGSRSSTLNVPIGIAAIVLTFRRSRDRATPRRAASTGSGVTTFSASLFMLVLALLRGNEEGWGSTLIVRLLGGVGGAVRRVHRRRDAPAAADAAAAPVPHPGLHGSAARRLRDLRVDVRAVPLPHALHAEHPRPVAARDRAAVPAADGRLVPRRTGRGSAALEAAGPRHACHRAPDWRASA